MADAKIETVQTPFGPVHRVGFRTLDVSPEVHALRTALRELLDAFDICPDDLEFDEYETIVGAAKSRARALL